MKIKSQKFKLNYSSLKKQSGLIVSKVSIAIILSVLLLLPLVRMFFYIDGTTINKVISNVNFGSSIFNSFVTTLISTVLSISLAYTLAYSISRSNIKFKVVFISVILLPMLIPSISHGLGLITLFGNNGIVTNFLNIKSNLYGYVGIIFGSIIYSFPVAFLMFIDVLKYENYSIYEAGEVLGMSKWQQFKHITFPYLRKPLISIVFAVFTMILTDYGIPLSVGGKIKTLPTMLYEEAVGQLNYSAGVFIGLFLLIPAIIAFIIDIINKDNANSSYVTKKFYVRKNKLRDTFAYIINIIISIFILSIIVSFAIQAFSKSYPINNTFSFDHLNNTIKKNGLVYLKNSVLISLLTAVFGVIIAFFTAYLTSRTRTKATKFLHILSIISLAIPGLILGLSYIITFNSSLIYGTIIICILVNTMHFFASPYLMMYNAFNKMNKNLESVGSVLGISRFRIIKDVLIPQSKSTLLEMFSYFFVNSMITISAVSFLATRLNKPISLMINQFEAYNMMESAAIVAIMILAVNILTKIIIAVIKKIVERKNVNKNTI